MSFWEPKRSSLYIYKRLKSGYLEDITLWYIWTVYWIKTFCSYDVSLGFYHDIFGWY